MDPGSNNDTPSSDLVAAGSKILAVCHNPDHYRDRETAAPVRVAESHPALGSMLVLDGDDGDREAT